MAKAKSKEVDTAMGQADTQMMSPMEDDAPSAAPSEPAAEAAAEPAPVMAVPKKYRVKRESPVHMNGCLTHLMAGQVVDAQHYGVDAIEKMKMQGVELEEIV